ncbi:FG-GAP repeat domain-containing protein [Flavobacterium sp. 3HN19-14]|uniref:FG-GAP repeat domain-containing protein n=1 Tax=Flavobacterium sp. 3HN19-14 TaxID=3448133 RepID=UPI003EE0F807
MATIIRNIIASSYSMDTFYYRNTDGLGTFEQQYMSVFGAMQSVYPADIDGDGDRDIVGISALGGGGFDAVIWYENSDGHFTEKHDITTLEVHGESIIAADLDNDGDTDVLTADGHPYTTGQLAWYENSGNGSFSPQKIIQQVADYTVPSCVNVADIDNDNDMDVLSVFGYDANYTLSKVSVFENLGEQGNEITGKVTLDTNANGCTADDVKGSNIMVISGNAGNTWPLLPMKTEISIQKREKASFTHQSSINCRNTMFQRRHSTSILFRAWAMSIRPIFVSHL